MPTTTPLSDLVAQRLNLHWDDFAKAHPHLAAAINRVQLVESAVAALHDDPQLAAALKQAGIDEARLSELTPLVSLIDGILQRLLTLL